MSKLEDILYSLKINYKTWLSFFIAIYFLYSHNFIIGIINFIIFFLLSYFGHYISHMKFIKLFNPVHTYHHTKNNLFSFITELLYEFVMATAFTFFKISLLFIFNNTYFSNILEYINIPINILIFMFYTSVHYINYSYFHINNVHELHHKNIHKNLGPDICDIIFGTKYEIKNTIENTDHYIPNILISFLIIYLTIQIYKNSNSKNIFKYTFFYTYLFSLIILFFSNIYIFTYIFHKKLKKKYNKLKKKYNKLKIKIVKKYI
jgi:hypothetical protein